MVYFCLQPRPVPDFILNLLDNISADIIILYWKKYIKRKKSRGVVNYKKDTEPQELYFEYIRTIDRFEHELTDSD
jgi:hypothetical protein